jgi:O-methyltransferase
LLDDQVRFLPGWFKDTLHDAPIERIALLRLDGDLYESTIQSLDALYPRLSPGGFCVIDDYHALEACRQAVADYRAKHGVFAEIVEIDGTGVFWRK